MAAAKPKKLLFVCTGNLCRSVMAERLAAKLSAERGLEWQAQSCGIAPARGLSVPVEVAAALSRRGVAPFEHSPRAADKDLLRWADVVLALAREHGEELIDRWPQFRFKIHVLRSYAGLPEPDVEDPMGLTPEDYEAAAAAIEEAVLRLSGAA